MHAAGTWRCAVSVIAALGAAGCASTADSARGANLDESRASSGADLARRIADTTWEWSGDYGAITFGNDGYCRLQDWDSRGLVTSWKAIDDHSVLLTIERGRDTDRYAICIFNADFKEYAGFNFHDARKFDVSRQITPR